ncbi:HPr family phosphocarrier protein [Anaerorhabdus sp.]|uniref:HPr family phosphocarrier protein n=1 Tax=Anaerorhabdus sp. TaxID=1872524 RepID=UPI002FC82497
MKQISVLVIDPVGLHARPATVAVNVMSLGIPTQSEVVVSCEGEDEEIAIKTIEEVLRAQKVIA